MIAKNPAKKVIFLLIKKGPVHSTGPRIPQDKII